MPVVNKDSIARHRDGVEIETVLKSSKLDDSVDYVTIQCCFEAGT